MDDIKSLAQFVLRLGDAKRLERFRGMHYYSMYEKEPDRYDSVADHSWRLACLSMLMAPKLSQRVDMMKMIQIALMHDVPEIICGDSSPFDEDGGLQSSDNRLAKAEMERRAAEEVFEGRGDLFDLWEEYEARESFESRVVAALDKIEASMEVVWIRDGKMFVKHFDFCKAYMRKYASVDPAVEVLAEEVILIIQSKFEAYGES